MWPGLTVSTGSLTVQNLKQRVVNIELDQRVSKKYSALKYIII